MCRYKSRVSAKRQFDFAQVLQRQITSAGVCTDQTDLLPANLEQLQFESAYLHSPVALAELATCHWLLVTVKLLN
jgi:hypothetical protein